MQKQIKLLYDPYENQIKFSISQDGGETWDRISETSDLRRYENQNCVLANCAEDIVSIINKYQNVGVEGVLVCFEGTEEDFDLLQEVIERENKANSNGGKISSVRIASFKSADEAIEIIRTAYDRISSEFSDYLPECEGFEDMAADEQEIGQTISTFNSTVSTEIPVCIIGTYSIGKSALINAIVGAEVLPSAVKQCTAKNVRVIDADCYTITIEFDDKEIAFSVSKGGIVAVDTSDEAEELTAALQKLIDFSEMDEVTAIRNILRVLNGEIKSDISASIGFNVTISLPFKGSILNNETAHIVLYDTPGSDNSDVDQRAHRVALEEMMQHQTNALPVFIMDREHALSNDHKDVKTLIDGNKSGFSSPNCIIVFSKAERLTESQYREEIPTTLINWHGGITFLHVCAIGALGAKKSGETWSDSQYEEVYRDWYRKYSEDGKSLPKYNRVPCGRIMESSVRNCVSDELFASGIPSLEDEINYYVLRYANYKKCVNGRELLLQAMELAKKKLQKEEQRLKQDKKKKEEEQASIRNQLLTQMRSVSPQKIDVYNLARSYDKVLHAYFQTVPRAVEQAWRNAQTKTDKKAYMIETLQTHCMENLFIPTYEGENGIAHQIIKRLVDYAGAYISKLRQIVEERQDSLSQEARSELEETFSSIDMPEFESIGIKGAFTLLEFSSFLNFKWLEEKGLESIANSICTNLDIHKKGIFKKTSYYGAFQMQCIINPVNEYQRQLQKWTGENCSLLEQTINRDNAILSQYDAEIAATEARIQDLKERLARLDDVRQQLDVVLSITEGAN
ncbi:dynamin family protein [Fournierella massiliensis]|nr:dynamin family protein [Fournierella massiliensis]MCF2556001.1 dynamin family protein [Fournierella massiliensis]